METLSTDRQPVSPGCLRGAEWSSRNGPSSPMLLVPGTERGIRGPLGLATAPTEQSEGQSEG